MASIIGSHGVIRKFSDIPKNLSEGKDKENSKEAKKE